LLETEKDGETLNKAVINKFVQQSIWHRVSANSKSIKKQKFSWN